MFEFLQKIHADGSNFRIYDINFDKKAGLPGDNFIDSVFIGRTKTTEDKHGKWVKYLLRVNSFTCSQK